MAPQEMNSPPSEGAQKEDFLRFYKVSSCRARAEDVMLAARKIGPLAAHLEGGGDDMAPHLGGDDMGGGERQTRPWYSKEPQLGKGIADAEAQFEVFLPA